jgi:hypothetical protein
MTLDFVKKFFTVDMLSNQVQRVTMCGDIGDPIYCKEYIEICRYIKSVNPNIHICTITNGSYKKPTWWRELASVLNHRDTINFSIDGYDNASNNLYRVNSNFESIVQGIQAIRKVNKDVFLVWAAIIFAFNQDHMGKIVDQARSLEMDAVQWTRSTKFKSIYSQYGGDSDLLEPRAEFISKTYRYEHDLVNISGRAFTNADHLEYLKKKYFQIKKKYENSPVVPLCEIGNRGIYVNANGDVFPCSWVSFPYTSLTHGDKTIQWKDNFFNKHQGAMNLHNRTFKEIVSDPSWNKCSQGFTDPTKTWVECNQKCSNSTVDEKYAVN